MSNPHGDAIEPYKSWTYDEYLEALLSGIEDDYLGLWQVPWLLSRAGVNTVDQRREIGMRLVRDLVQAHGLVPGFLADGGGFDPWALDAEAALARIEREWAEFPGDPNISDICWFDLPDRVARRHHADGNPMDHGPQVKRRTGVRNASLLQTIFGRWPSFHDAEVLALRLDRNAEPERPSPTLEIDVYLFESTPEVDDRGFFVLRNQTRATLAFYGVDELQFEGFNNQNALFDLKLKDIADRQLERLRWEVSFQPAYGLGGTFLCEEIEVLHAEPYRPVGPALGSGRQSPPRKL